MIRFVQSKKFINLNNIFVDKMTSNIFSQSRPEVNTIVFGIRFINFCPAYIHMLRNNEFFFEQKNVLGDMIVYPFPIHLHLLREHVLTLYFYNEKGERYQEVQYEAITTSTANLGRIDTLFYPFLNRTVRYMNGRIDIV